jgi:hypothetical protein
MNDKDLKQLLSQYIDGQLAEPDRAFVEKQLKSEPRWADYYEKLLKLKQTADNFVLGGDREYWDRRKNAVLESIKDSESARIIPVRTRDYKSILYRLAAVAASIALVALISIFETKYDHPARYLFSDQEVPSQTLSPAPVDKATQDEAKEAGYDEEIPPREYGELAEAGREIARENGEEIGKDARVAEMLSRDKVEVISDRQPPILEKTTVKKGLPTEFKAEEAPDESKAPAIMSAEPVALREEHQTGVEPDEDMPTGAAAREQERALSKPVPEDRGRGQEETRADEFVSTPVESLLLDRKITVTAETIDKDRFIDSRQITMTTASGRDTLVFGRTAAHRDSIYLAWRLKAGGLKAKYSYLLTEDREEYSSLKESLSADTISSAVILDIAEAFYMLGALTPDETERQEMLGYLKIVYTKADSATASKIDAYISDLLSILR